MRFVKMHGLGNDYVYVDAFTDGAIETHKALPDLARRASDRHTGIGSDGLILVCRPRGRADVRMRMFNADGSESEMCGNGVRCVAKFAHDRLGIRTRPMKVETGRGVLQIDYRLSDGKVREATVDMGEPILDADRIPVSRVRQNTTDRVIDAPLAWYVPIDAAGLGSLGVDPTLTCVSMGNPHAVLFCADAAAVPLDRLGPFLETQPVFPGRINVHFVQVVSKDEAVMRTWERGAGATRACGTGACASLVAGALTRRLKRSVRMHLPGGDLELRWDEPTNHVFMTGPATDVFEGEWLDAHEDGWHWRP